MAVMMLALLVPSVVRVECGEFSLTISVQTALMIVVLGFAVYFLIRSVLILALYGRERDHVPD